LTDNFKRLLTQTPGAQGEKRTYMGCINDVDIAQFNQWYHFLCSIGTIATDIFPAHQQQLQLYIESRGLIIRPVDLNSNCLFNSISDQLVSTFDQAPQIRSRAVDWLRRNRDLICMLESLYWSHVTNWDQYCDNMRNVNTWGDHLAVMAIAEVYQLRILIVSAISLDGKHITEIIPKFYQNVTSNPKTILISHWGNWFFGSLFTPEIQQSESATKRVRRK